MERCQGFGGFTGSYGCLLTAVVAADALRFRSTHPRPLLLRGRDLCRIESASDGVVKSCWEFFPILTHHEWKFYKRMKNAWNSTEKTAHRRRSPDRLPLGWANHRPRQGPQEGRPGDWRR